MTKGTTDISAVCSLLDKLTLQSLHLMEEKLEAEMALETASRDGGFHLAKSRYIMGQSSVSSLRLPTEESSEFAASVVCDREDRQGVIRLQIRDSESEDTVKPIKWFGVLVPQNLYKAQGIFRSALDYVVECANIHIQLADTLDNISILRRVKETH